MNTTMTQTTRTWASRPLGQAACGIALGALVLVGAAGSAGAATAGTTGSTFRVAASSSSERGVDVSELIAAATAADEALRDERALVDGILAQAPVVTTDATRDASIRVWDAIDAYVAAQEMGVEGRLRDAQIALGVNLRVRAKAMSLGSTGTVYQDYPDDDVQETGDLEKVRRDLVLEQSASGVFARDVAAVTAEAARSLPVRPAGPDTVRGQEYRAAFAAADGVASWTCGDLPRQPWDGSHLVVDWTKRSNTVRQGVVTSPALPGAAEFSFLGQGGVWDSIYLNACDLRTPSGE